MYVYHHSKKGFEALAGERRGTAGDGVAEGSPCSLEGRANKNMIRHKSCEEAEIIFPELTHEVPSNQSPISNQPRNDHCHLVEGGDCCVVERSMHKVQSFFIYDELA